MRRRRLPSDSPRRVTRPGVYRISIELWVTSIQANAVYAYSLPDLQPLGQVALLELKLPGRAPIGAVPNWVTFTPDSRLLYISNAAARSVSVIETGSLKLIATIPVGEVPKRINTLVLR